jgi:hypothetical protein
MRLLETKLETVLRYATLTGIGVFMLQPLFTVRYISITATVALFAFVICAASVRKSPKMETPLGLVLFAGVTHLLISMVNGGIFAPEFRELSAIAMYFGLGMLFVSSWQWFAYLFPEAVKEADELIVKEKAEEAKRGAS